MNGVINKIVGLLCYWDFTGTNPLLSKGKYDYQLKEGNGKVIINSQALGASGAADFAEGQYFYIPRQECPALNISGPDAEVTVMAWVKRRPKSYVQCEAIAGMWNETEKKRQYCLFLNLQLFDSSDQVCGHISGVGGPTPGQKWCIDASIGNKAVDYNEWCFVAFSYDGKQIKSYRNGILDIRQNHNPYSYDQGIFDPGSGGADFTVAAVHRLGEMGNYFVGQISQLAVFNRTLTDIEINLIYTTYSGQH